MAIPADLFETFETSRTVYTVSRLNREARFVLNELFGTLWIEGEISNFSAPSSGHLYFTLKDAEAQVRCAMFRPQARLLPFKPKNGDHVLAKAEVGLYEPRGDFQLIVETLEPAGDGALLRAFEALKQRLAAEGLFDAASKRPIPELPQCIGVITSPTGAAVRDILTVLRRRFPAIPVIVFPVKVQGSEAKAEIVRALEKADRLKLCDVLILARGGGSPEDLWAFNEEAVARAIHTCRIPIISAVGHEIDFTIADFVADLRAPTPSAAAEAASPDGLAWLDRFERLEARLGQSAQARLNQAERLLGFLEKRLQQLHPEKRFTTQAQRLDELESRLRRAMRHHLALRETRLHTEAARLLRHRPDQRLMLLHTQTEQLGQRLRSAIRRRIETLNHDLSAAGQQLNAVSPLATLARGYSITTRADDGAILRSCHDAPPGSRIETRIAGGTLVSTVDSIHPQAPPLSAKPD
jgi:exodeoxyribonuclease VII large subunit